MEDAGVMNDSVIWLRAFGEEYLKIAAELAGKQDVYGDVLKKLPQLAHKEPSKEKKASTGVSFAVPISPSSLGAEDSLAHNMLNGGLLGGTVGLMGAYGAEKNPKHMLQSALVGGGIGAMAGAGAHGARRLLKKEEDKTAGFIGAVKGGLQQAAKHLHDHEDAYEIGGLGVLGAIGADRLQAHARAGIGASNHAIENKQMLGETGHAALDTAGLGMLAAPLVAKKMLGH